MTRKKLIKYATLAAGALGAYVVVKHLTGHKGPTHAAGWHPGFGGQYGQFGQFGHHHHYDPYAQLLAQQQMDQMLAQQQMMLDPDAGV